MELPSSQERKAKRESTGGNYYRNQRRIEETRTIEDHVGKKVKINGEIWNIYTVYSNKMTGKFKMEMEEKLEE